MQSGIVHGGDDLLELVIKAGLYTPDDDSYFPRSPVGTFVAGGRRWHGSNGTGMVSFDLEASTWTVYNFRDGFAPGNHVRILSADDEFLFFLLGDFATQGEYGPGLLVYSMRRGAFRRIVRVSTLGGQFGHFSYEALRKRHPRHIGPQVAWSHRHLANEAYADLTSDWLLSNPSSVRREGDEYVLSYFESWKIEEFATRLRISLEDLDRGFR